MNDLLFSLGIGLFAMNIIFGDYIFRYWNFYNSVSLCFFSCNKDR